VRAPEIDEPVPAQSMLPHQLGLLEIGLNPV
jgi:hypothetical protein